MADRGWSQARTRRGGKLSDNYVPWLDSNLGPRHHSLFTVLPDSKSFFMRNLTVGVGTEVSSLGGG